MKSNLIYVSYTLTEIFFVYFFLFAYLILLVSSYYQNNNFFFIEAMVSNNSFLHIIFLFRKIREYEEKFVTPKNSVSVQKKLLSYFNHQNLIIAENVCVFNPKCIQMPSYGQWDDLLSYSTARVEFSKPRDY